MNEVYKIIGGRFDGKFLEIEPDQDAESPRGYDNVGKFLFPRGTKLDHLDESDDLEVLDSREKLEIATNFGLGNVLEALQDAADEHLDAEDCLDLINAEVDSVILPVYCYEHGAIALSTGRFSCPWDSGQVGWIIAEPDRVQRHCMGDKDHVRQCLDAEVEVFSQYLNGDVYGFLIYGEDGVMTDSVWGFYGNDPRSNGMQDHIDFEDLAESDLA